MTMQWLNQSEQILFGRNIPPEIDILLQQAVYASSFDDSLAEKKLWEAQQLNPSQLEVYIAIYKFYFYRGRLKEAMQTVRQALDAAAKVGGFNPDWRKLRQDSTDWSAPESPQRVYLYSLKALGFILLRLGSVDESYQILEKLYQIDPYDQTGASVIRELAKGVMQEET